MIKWIQRILTGKSSSEDENHMIEEDFRVNYTVGIK